MAAIRLTTPNGLPAAIETTEIILIFFSPYLSPSGSHSNIVLGDSIRSFKEEISEAAALVLESIKLVRLNLPDAGKGKAKGEIWLRVDLITAVTATRSGQTSVMMNRRKGPILVTETLAEAEAAISAARA